MWWSFTGFCCFKLYVLYVNDVPRCKPQSPQLDCNFKCIRIRWSTTFLKEFRLTKLWMTTHENGLGHILLTFMELSLNMALKVASVRIFNCSPVLNLVQNLVGNQRNLFKLQTSLNSNSLQTYYSLKQMEIRTVGCSKNWVEGLHRASVAWKWTNSK